jgi:hypothetical protein
MRISRRMRAAFAAIGVTCAMFVFLLLGLNGLAVWAETNARAFPYKEGETPLRFLLPSIFGRPGRARIMLTGPSSAQEALLYEKFERAFPGYEAYQAAFSNATLDEVLLSLDYIEQVYGRDALPEVMVIGGEPRFFNNLPRRFGPRGRTYPRGSFFTPLIERYSPFRVEATENGTTLAGKTTWERLNALYEFWMSKQQPRQRVAIAALLSRVLSGPGPNLEMVEKLPPLNIREPFSALNAAQTRRFVAAVGPYTAFRQWLAAYTSPYLEQYKGPWQNIRPDGMSRLAHWGDDDAALLNIQIKDLVERTKRLQIKLFVIMMPRNPANDVIDASLPMDKFNASLRRALGDTPYLDLQTLLQEQEFADPVHATRPGARRVTAEIVHFMQLYGGMPE